MTRRVVPIVEGHSEADSIPAFIRRILHDRSVFEIEPDRAIREHRQRLAKPDVLLNRIRMAENRDGCAAVLVLFDADDDAACELGPQLADAARGSGITTPLQIVIAVREIESWIIAGIASLRGCRGILEDAEPPNDVESVRGAKEWIKKRKTNGYKPTIDLLPLLMRLDYQDARTRAPSLDRFLRLLEALV